ncbi:prephenate dehydrogenase/arogenate dehydrogenase family protein [Bifidobacterium aerophilum]|uniref:Prephenate dehydrogenase/arogenate dehydrogenase family protein n=2 Tax=Bifidobacterium aerophilum TaxID=1798155 RepID=A0A6N9Z3D2_9BIFI|nr:prephenate dehydrogenase/arogenate dehydrogenase family protein [Bifidobacterium aerophilum]NEG88693.1 prephenate dehydrogenase/arogenate dehydrogenase family protein [Bifidobacterium aerophilum]
MRDDVAKPIPVTDTYDMTVGIVGLGLIGGSLARRLVRRGTSVIAWNHRDHPYSQAEADGIRCVPTLTELAEAKPSVIVLCNPLKAMPAILTELKPILDPAATTLTDVGSVKGMVRDQVEAAGLGECYVGAHPMAGNELSGWQAADPALYDDALWAITVRDDTDYARFHTVLRLIVDGVGNRVIVLNDIVHDQAAALISHMPHVVATALINQLTDDPNRNIAAALAAGSWRDMTRVALTDPDRTRAMVDEDAVNVESLLRSMAARLTAVADALHNGDGDEMARFFADGQPFRDYKMAQRAGIVRYEERDVTFDPSRWQADLLASARRGEHIIGFAGDHAVRVQVRSAV